MNIEEFLEEYEKEHSGSGTTQISLEFVARLNDVFFQCPTHLIFEKHLEPRGWTKRYEDTPINPHLYIMTPETAKGKTEDVEGVVTPFAVLGDEDNRPIEDVIKEIENLIELADKEELSDE